MMQVTESEPALDQPKDLSEVPTSILLRIFSHILDVGGKMSLGACCKRLWSIMKDKRAWKAPIHVYFNLDEGYASSIRVCFRCNYKLYVIAVSVSWEAKKNVFLSTI